MPILLLLLACTPLTQYRNAALVAPTAAPPLVGPVLEPGVAGVGAGVDIGFAPGAVPGPASVRVASTLYPQEGDPGLWVSQHKAHLWARTGITRGVEAGARAEMSSRLGAVASSIGVPPIDADATWGVGGTLGVQIPAEAPVGLVLRSEAMMVAVPWSRWQLEDGVSGETVFGDGLEFYQPDDSGVSTRLRVSATAAVAGKVQDFEVAGGFAVVGQQTNVGFSDKVEEPVIAASPAFLPVASVAYRADAYRVAVQGWGQPLGRAQLGYASPSVGICTTVELLFGAPKP